MKHSILKLILTVSVFVTFSNGGDDYYVANEGDNWRYNGSILFTGNGKVDNTLFTLDREQIASRIMNGKKVAVVKTYTDQKFSSLDFSYMDGRGMYSYGEQDVGSVSPEIYNRMYYKYPLTVGTSWIKEDTTYFIGSGHDFSLNLQCSIIGNNEDVMVTAGEYKNCLKIKCQGKKTSKKITVEIEDYLWLAPGVGEVKNIYVEKTTILLYGFHKAVAKYTLELKSYTPSNTSILDKVKNYFTTTKKESKVFSERKEINNNYPPYFKNGTKCVDHDDARNGEWLNEMYRKGGVLDSNGCLLKKKNIGQRASTVTKSEKLSKAIENSNNNFIDAKSLFSKCAGCHGVDGQKKALGKSDIIAGEDTAVLVEILHEYKNGLRSKYGMGMLMKGQVASLNNEEIRSLSEYISKMPVSRKKLNKKQSAITQTNINKKTEKVVPLNSIKITNYSHPDDEPKGLYIVDLQAGNQSKIYRLYCPKKMVRDITDNTYGKSRSIEDEDSITFSGNSVLRKAYQKICSIDSSNHQSYHTQQTVIPVIVNHTDIGTVRGISRNGDGFIAIRSGPDGKYKMIDKLYRNGEKVIVSDNKGKWKGVVYGNSKCLQGLPKQKAKPYDGTCKTGWVYGKYIKTEYITTSKNNSSLPPPKTKQKSKKVRQLNYKVLGVKSLKVMKGMHFVKVKVGGKRKEFSLFCPTSTIEDITNTHHKIERYIQLERKLPYSDSQMVVNMFNKICKKK